MIPVALHPRAALRRITAAVRSKPSEDGTADTSHTPNGTDDTSQTADGTADTTDTPDGTDDTSQTPDGTADTDQAPDAFDDPATADGVPAVSADTASPEAGQARSRNRSKQRGARDVPPTPEDPTGEPSPGHDTPDRASVASPKPVRGTRHIPDWREGPRPLDELAVSRDDNTADGDAPDTDDAHDTEAEADDGGEGGEGDGGDGAKGSDNPSAPRKYLRKTDAYLREVKERDHARPTYQDWAAVRRSPFDWWHGISPSNRWLIYNASAFGIGWYFGIPQFARDEVDFCVTTYGAWDSPAVGVWYLAVLMTWMLNRSSRHWWPPAALIARVPWVSTVVGVLLYGSTDLPT